MGNMDPSRRCAMWSAGDLIQVMTIIKYVAPPTDRVSGAVLWATRTLRVHFMLHQLIFLVYLRRPSLRPPPPLKPAKHRVPML